jgi:hypothetical protein
MRGGPHKLARRWARTIRAIKVAPLNARAVLIVGHEVKLSVGCIPQLSRGGALGILDQIQYLEYKQQDMRNNSQEVVPPVCTWSLTIVTLATSLLLLPAVVKKNVCPSYELVVVSCTRRTVTKQTLSSAIVEHTWPIDK